MIPVSCPDFGDDEINAIIGALRRGEISGSFGKSIPDFEAAFANYVGTKYAVAVSSGTTALQIAVRVAGITSGDEVLLSSCTNIATALAITHNNAIPVPVDSEPVTWNLNLDLIEPLITFRTRAIIPVHIYGHPVDMDRLMGIARKHHLTVIEDCAESHGATCRKKMTGSFGEMGCFSFYANKIITTGEGGMVTTDNQDLAEKLKLLRNLSFTTPRFKHEIAGYNFRMTGLQAAMGLVQLNRIEKIIEEKRRVAATYQEHLSSIAGLQLPAELEWARNVYWMYGIVLNEEFPLSRDELVIKLASEGIETRTFFCPMSQQPCLLNIPGFRATDCSVADQLWLNGLYLPSSHTLTKTEIIKICHTISASALQRKAA